MKFEDTWAAWRLGVHVGGWAWDTMLAAHVLDNRPGISGLKFQAYVRYGIGGYNTEVKPYLESPGKNGNAHNRIEELIKTATGRQRLLVYCGMDALLERRLALDQMKEMR
jgi:hypothetical protein